MASHEQLLHQQNSDSGQTALSSYYDHPSDVKTEYTFSIETWIQHTDRIHIETNVASIELIPDPDEKKNSELTKATVTLDGDGSANLELAFSARLELMKTILRHTVKGARVIDGVSVYMPESWKLIPTPDDDPEIEMKRGVTVQLSGRKLASYDPSHNRTLKIDVNSNSPAIFCYYEAMRRTHPVDGYRELFKIVEYFSGTREHNDKDRKRILDHLGETWWIPNDALGLARNLQQDDSLTTKGLAENLYGLRGECSHMRTDYGVIPIDNVKLSEIARMSQVLEMIVKYSLERNPETKDRSIGEQAE